MWESLPEMSDGAGAGGEPIPCTLCGAISTEIYLIHPSGYRLLRCASCLVVFLDIKVSQSELKSFYGEGYFVGSGEVGYGDYLAMIGGLQKTFEVRLGRIRGEVGGVPPRTLDVGCGPGVFVCLARQKGWSCIGTELSEYASGVAVKKFKIPVVRSNFADGPFRTSAFDLVTLWDVIEHLDRPAHAIGEIRRILTPEGHVFLTTGDVRSRFASLSGRFWHLYNLPEHLFFFSRDSIRRLLEGNGFSICSISTAKGYYSVSYLMERLAKSVGWKRFRVAQRIPGLALFQRITLPLDLGDIMLVHAQKVK